MINAVQSDEPTWVDHLLDHGADIDARDDRGFTALHRAAEVGSVDLVRLLLRRGAAPAPEADGHTPRSLATAHEGTEILDLLDAAGG